MLKKPPRGRSRLGIAVVLVTLLASCASTPPPPSQQGAEARGHNVILVTVDGLRNEELFGGIDERVLGSVENSGIEYESESARVRTA